MKPKNISRRQALQFMLGTGALAPARIIAQNQSSKPRRGKIDVHHHVGPPPGSGGGRGGSTEWTPAIAVEEMDRNGVAVKGGVKLDHRGGEKLGHFIGGSGRGL